MSLTIARRLGLLGAFAVLVGIAAIAVQLLAMRQILFQERKVAQEFRSEVDTFLADVKAA